MERQKDYSAADEAVIARESRKHERLKDSVEKAEARAAKEIADTLKRSRRAIAQDLMDATNDRGRRDDLFDIVERAGGGGFHSDDEKITGKEPRPWEND
jgi:hypothetical protein